MVRHTLKILQIFKVCLAILGHLGAHRVGGGGGGPGGLPRFTPALFRYSSNCVLKFLTQFRRNALKNQFKKRKNSSKRCTNGILLKFFSAILRRILKRDSHQ